MVLHIRLVETIPYLELQEGKWLVLDSPGYSFKPGFFIPENEEVSSSKLYFSSCVTRMDQIPPVPLFRGGNGMDRGPGKDTAHAE